MNSIAAGITTTVKIEFSENPGYPDDGGDYEDILLKDIYPLKSLKLYYIFDLGDHWLFEIRKSRKKAKPNKDELYPRVVFRQRY